MKKNVVLFSIIFLFIIIILNNNCFALETGVYTIDVSNIEYQNGLNDVFYQFYHCVKDQLNYDFLNDNELANNVFFFSTATINDNVNYRLTCCSSNIYENFSDYNGFYFAFMPTSAGKYIDSVYFNSSSSTVDFKIKNNPDNSYRAGVYLQNEKPISNVPYDFSAYNSSFIQDGDVMNDILSNVRPDGLKYFIDNLLGFLTLSVLFDHIQLAIPLIVVCVLFVISFYLLRYILHRFK